MIVKPQPAMPTWHHQITRLEMLAKAGKEGFVRLCVTDQQRSPHHQPIGISVVGGVIVEEGLHSVSLVTNVRGLPLSGIPSRET